jgi:hypothetical protein
MPRANWECASRTGAGWSRISKALWASIRSLSNPGTTYIYTPPIGEVPGQVVPVLTGSDTGLPEATRRLALLRTWRERQEDPARHSACPEPPLALQFLADRPPSANERARLDETTAGGKLGRGQCLWRLDERRLTTVPCEVLPLPMLAAMARKDDLRAMFELGIRFEEGRGVAKDPRQAEALYCAAGLTRITGGGYAKNGDGAVRWITLSGQPGLPEAA